MAGYSANSDQASQTSNTSQLPLFRPEAILAKQQKAYGEILLIQPLSLTFCAGLAIVAVTAIFGYLLFGKYTEQISVAGIVAPSATVAITPGTVSSLSAYLFVPRRYLPVIQPGARVIARSESCNNLQFHQLNAVVEEVSSEPTDPGEIWSLVAVRVSDPLYRVRVVFPDQNLLVFEGCAQRRIRIEALLRLQRKPLLGWLINSSGSTAIRD